MARKISLGRKDGTQFGIILEKRIDGMGWYIRPFTEEDGDLSYSSDPMPATADQLEDLVNVISEELREND